MTKKQILNNPDIIALKSGDLFISPAEISEKDAGNLEFLVFSSDQGKEIYRHSTSHIMAHAVKELFPDVKIAIGPATEDGFYYDFDCPKAFTPEDLAAIEQKMQEIINRNNPFVRKEMPKTEAIEFFKSMGETYKVEILSGIDNETVSLYEEGGFIDLCRGPHLPSTSSVKVFKLTAIAGAYWRGDEKNKMLQRIYGVSFPKKDDLKAYLTFVEEVKKRDHRKLGKELDLFSISDEFGAGLVLWHPKGAAIRKEIEDFWRDEHYKAGYQLLFSPHIARLDIWKKSGHVDFYRENMYPPISMDNIEYEIKPMNCPFHIYIYKSQLRSYRDLPIRYAELGTVYRYERSGVLHGLLRVRGFTQDDAHIFCTEEQIESEIDSIVDFTLFVLKTFGFKDYDIYLSTRPEKFVGTLENWDKATNALENTLKRKALPYRIDPQEGVFYGPKIDIKVKDALGRSWQCSTIQVDFNNPERFQIHYRGGDGKEHQPIMIHRALMGSLERFFGVLIEHYAGSFPLWLAPVQVAIITIADRHLDYAMKLKALLQANQIRVELDGENEKMGAKIRKATLAKIPYLFIVGDKELKDEAVSVRKKDGSNLGVMSIEQAIQLIVISQGDKRNES
jgi:threonyl-tRNA synthetase